MTSTEGLPITDVWWVRLRVGDGVSLVTEPHVHPFLRCNVWHVQGRDAGLVVDTGMGIRPLRPFVERELDGDLIAVATHAHSDHVVGLHEFEQRAIHQTEAETVAGAQLAALATEVYGPKTIGVYEAAGYVFRELLIDAIPDGGVEAYYEIAPADATRVVSDGDVIDLGDRAFDSRSSTVGTSSRSVGIGSSTSATPTSACGDRRTPLGRRLPGRPTVGPWTSRSRRTSRPCSTSATRSSTT